MSRVGSPVVATHVDGYWDEGIKKTRRFEIGAIVGGIRMSCGGAGVSEFDEKLIRLRHNGITNRRGLSLVFDLREEVAKQADDVRLA